MKKPKKYGVPDVKFSQDRPDVIAKLKNDSKAVRIVVDAYGTQVSLAPGAVKAMRLPATYLGRLATIAPDLTVISQREA